MIVGECGGFVMAFCKNCGTDIGDANLCSACGTVQVEETPATPVFAADPSSYTSDTSSFGGSATSGTTEVPASTGSTIPGSSDSTIPMYSAPVYSSPTQEMPKTTGQIVFAIINIALGLIFCCCLYGLSLVATVLGVIALVMAIQAGKAASAEEAQQKLKTVKLLNIIGVAVAVGALVLGLIIGAASGASSYSTILNDYSDLYGS